ncbi:hypothetical protein MTO96_019735 [Rhipicephalus appendiculatus]
MPNVEPRVNQSHDEGVQDGGVDAHPHTDSPHRLSSVYSLRSFSTVLDDYQECRNLSHLGIMMPVYLIPLLALGTQGTVGGSLYCLFLPLLLWAFNSLPKPGAALVHLVTVPVMGLMEAEQVAHQYMSLDVLILALVFFLVVIVDRWSELALFLAQGTCEQFGLRRGKLFVWACLCCFVCASLISGTVVSTTLLYLLDRVLSTIFKQNMDRPPELFRGGSQPDSSSLRSVQASDQLLFDRLSQVVLSLKKPESKKGSFASKQRGAEASGDKTGQESGTHDSQENPSVKRRFSIWRQIWSRKSSTASDEHAQASATLRGRSSEIQPTGGQHTTAGVPAKAVDSTTTKLKLSSATPDTVASTVRASQKPPDPGVVRVDIANEGMLHSTTSFAVGNNARSLGYPTDQKPHGSQHLGSALPKVICNIDKQSAAVSLAHSPATTSKGQVPRERRGTLNFLFGKRGSRSRRNSKGGDVSRTLSPKSVSSRVFRNLGLIARRLSISKVPAAQQQHAVEDGSLANRIRTSGSPLNIAESSEAGPNVKPSGSGFIEAYGVVRPPGDCVRTAQDKGTPLNLEAMVRSPQIHPAVSRDYAAGATSEDTRAGSTAIVPKSTSRDTNIADLPASDPVSITTSDHVSQNTWLSHERVSARRSKRVRPGRSSDCHKQRKKLADAGIGQAKHDAEGGSRQESG